MIELWRFNGSRVNWVLIMDPQDLSSLSARSNPVICNHNPEQDSLVPGDLEVRNNNLKASNLFNKEYFRYILKSS